MSIKLKKDGNDLNDATLMGEVAKEVEKITKIIEDSFGPVDKTYSLTAINFCSQDIWCTEVCETLKTIVIHLPFYVTRSGKEWQRSLNLSHELVHTITPCENSSNATFLDEGLAVVFSERYINKGRDCTGNNNQKYSKARGLVLKLFNTDEKIIKKLRSKYPDKKISDYTIQDIVEENPLVDRNLAESLTEKFYG